MMICSIHGETPVKKRIAKNCLSHYTNSLSQSRRDGNHLLNGYLARIRLLFAGSAAVSSHEPMAY